jgi:hypothetical protein
MTIEQFIEMAWQKQGNEPFRPLILSRYVTERPSFCWRVCLGNNIAKCAPTILTKVQLRILVGGGIDDVCRVIYGMDIARNCQRGI